MMNYPEKALFYIEQNLRIIPNDLDTLCHKSFNLALMGYKNEAEDLLNDIVKKYPNEINKIQTAFAGKYLREGKTAQGILSFVEASKPINKLFDNTLKMPTYYSPDLPFTCVTPAEQINNLPILIGGVSTDSLLNTQSFNVINGNFVPNDPSSYSTSIQAENGLLIAGKYQQTYTNTQIVLPSAPRTLTNAQLYTINSINNNNNNLTNYLAKAPTSSDILAIIPVKTSAGVPTGSLLVEFSGSLQDSVRTYFGPVNIERMAVKLLDDKGNILNLNGNDWCVSLIAECLYQY
jgi:tetratricopeptide (TPR) repeat protein